MHGASPPSRWRCARQHDVGHASRSGCTLGSPSNTSSPPPRASRNAAANAASSTTPPRACWWRRPGFISASSAAAMAWWWLAWRIRQPRSRGDQLAQQFFRSRRRPAALRNSGRAGCGCDTDHLMPKPSAPRLATARRCGMPGCPSVAPCTSLPANMSWAHSVHSSRGRRKCSLSAMRRAVVISARNRSRRWSLVSTSGVLVAIRRARCRHRCRCCCSPPP